jgi:group II intron reverse transcriptase/maturase
MSEVSEMLLQNAQKYLEVVRKRGEAKKGLRRVYRIICCQELYLLAYSHLYANKGALTPGVDPADTVDGMSMARIDTIIDTLKRHEYEWKPVRRTHILKRDGKRTRPLGIPGWSDKLVMEVIRMVLEAYYEPQFRDCSHGFRPGRGCHTALDAVNTWKGVRWFIEGDIKGCFDNLHFHIIIRILRRSIHDEAFLRLIRGMLEAGYVEDWKYHQTYSGTPQGGVVSPLLMNIVLHELDVFVEDVLIPQYTAGTRRKVNPEYRKLAHAIQKAQKEGHWKEANRLRRNYSKLPSKLQNDPNFRRLWYVRYADDTLFGFIGTRQEAEMIKRQLGHYLETIQLELSHEKTLITHAVKGKARFLNYEINRMLRQDKKVEAWNGKRICTRRAVNSNLWYAIPEDVVQTWKAKVMKREKGWHRAELMNLSDYDIIRTYEVELQGLINYYNRAHNQKRLKYLRYLWETSLLKTLANKYQTTVSTIIHRYRTFLTGDKRTLIGVKIPRPGKKPLQVIFGRKKIQRHNAVIQETIQTLYIVRNELITRLLATTCELCGKEETTLIGHHIRKLKDLKKRWEGRKKKPEWVKRMIAIRRKTLFICPECHNMIHSGKYDSKKLTEV